MKRLILRLLNVLGYDLVLHRGRGSLDGVLANAKRCGLAFATLIDVGAGRGDFSRTAQRHFPGTARVLIEPLAEFAVPLQAACAALPRTIVVNAAAAAESGMASLNVHPDLFGSSLLSENEDSDVNGEPRQVAAVTLDDVAATHKLEGPFLLKLDVQGAELEVLEGAGQTLSRTEMVILETSFFSFFEAGPLFAEVVERMGSLGFVLYDLFGLAHRPLDGALAQVDAVFVKSGSALRAHHHYATRAQRTAQTLRLKGSA